jgi:hypothetical protein
MIKEGDILICHTTYEHRHKSFSFNACEKYHVGYVHNLSNKLLVLNGKKMNYRLMVFNLTNGKFFYKNWFISLADWRDKQIDLILNDE